VSDENQSSRLAPTNECFADAMEFLEYQAQAFVVGQRLYGALARKHLARFKLVHAICVAPSGNHWAHGWVEENDGTVWTAQLLEGKRVYCEANKRDFYTHLRVLHTRVYSCEEALQENMRTGHLGPWDQKFYGLEGLGGEIIKAFQTTRGIRFDGDL
jgi:hypothetical protein